MEMVTINGIRYRPEAVPAEHRRAMQAEAPKGKARTSGQTRNKARKAAATKAEPVTPAKAEDGDGGDS